MKLYGKATYDTAGRRWAISVEPHVAIRLKRVFGKLSKNAVGVHFLSDTIENARDLQWFAERYPIKVTPASYLKSRANEHRERAALVDGFLSKRRPAPTFDLAVEAREYQRIAAGLLLGSGSLLLADDVGLGKTASAICTFTDPSALPALVVTLTHLPRQWQTEIKRFAPKLRVATLQSTTPYDLTLGPRGSRCTGKHRWTIDALADGGARCSRCHVTRDDAYHGREAAFPDVVITNYHKLAAWSETLAPVIRSLVFDECQELRSGFGGRDTPAKYNAARHLRSTASYCMGLSATPIYNYGGEFFSVLNIIKPESLGTHEEFVTEWCTGGAEKPQISDPKAFGVYVREAGLMLRRTRADVGRELPALTRVPHHIDADTDALERVSADCAELARLILKQGGEEFRGQKMMASEELSNKLRQATGIAKAPFVADFVRLLVESGEKVVIFGWHREVYSIWNDRLGDLKPAMYTGSESPAQKHEARRRFLEGETPVLIMSLRSGAGIDGLQNVCRTVVFGELDWSPGVHEQCEGRVGRDGQAHPVMSYFLIADSGSDPIVADVLGVKREQVDGLRDPDADIVTKLEVDGNNVKRLAEAYLAQQGAPTAARGAA